MSAWFFQNRGVALGESRMKTFPHTGMPGSLRSYLVRGVGGTIAIKVASMGIALITSLVLARLLGAAGYGAYAYAMAWVSLLVVPALMGWDQLLIRETAVYRTRSNWSLMRGLLRRTTEITLATSLGLAFLAALLIWVFKGRLESGMIAALWMAVTMLPLVTLTRLKGMTLRGLEHVVAGQLPETLIRPLLFIVIIGGIYLFAGEVLTAPMAVGMNVLSAGIALLIGIKLLNIALPKAAKEAMPVYDTRRWVFSALPLLFVGGMYVINDRADIAILGAIKGVEEAGIYAVANRGAGLITLLLMSANVALGPIVASMHAVDRKEKLQLVVTKSARVALFAAVPVACGMIFFGYWFLFFFGPEFTRGQTALAILSGGYLVNTAAGSVGLLLTMTGRERDVATGVGISAVLNVILNLILIPKWGMAGAATATATSMVLWNVLLAVSVYRSIGIHSTALGEIKFGREVCGRR